MEPQSGMISAGCHVEINLLDRHNKKSRLSFELVADDDADFEHGFLGVSTPIAKALLGEKAGITVPYLRDDILAIEIISVAPSTIQPPENAGELRQTRMNKTIREVEHTSAVVFASSFSGKWGDYDPDSLPKGEQPKEDEGGGEQAGA